MKNKTRIMIYPLAIMGMFLMLTNSCKKDDNNNTTPTGLIPVLTTTPVSDITSSTASCGGNITSDGGSAVIARGVCWNFSTTPTISDSKTTDGTGTGSFNSTITGLNPSTTYYVRAYATNSSSTGYGKLISFTTQSQSGQVPILVTSIVSAVTSSTATCGGNITSDGGSAVTIRGVCWGTSSNPTTANSKTTDGTGLGSFTSSITGLTVNTTYYVRAYATNSTSTGYGSSESFTTKQSGPIPGPNVTDIDGNVYHSVIIGTQTWTVENLKVTKYRDGSAIPNETDGTKWAKLFDLATGAYCNYNNSVSNSVTYGKLYNWFAVHDSRNLAPTGWHIPSDAELTMLTDYLGGENVAGNKLKEAGTIHWNSYNEATNETGFSALPGGERSTNGSFGGIGMSGRWWSSTEVIAGYYAYAYSRNMYTAGIYVIRDSGPLKSGGLSVRCVKD